MAYKLTYQVQISWVGPGAGPMEALSTPTGGALPGGGSNGQSKGFVVNNAVLPVAFGGTTFTQPNGTTIAGALASADITNLLAAMSSDLSTQMNASLGALQAWVAGNP